MSGLLSQLTEDIQWAQDIAVLTTVFLALVFGYIVIMTLRLTRKQAEEFKNIPLDDDNGNNSIENNPK